jgi:hypothetical protein
MDATVIATRYHPYLSFCADGLVATTTATTQNGLPCLLLQVDYAYNS